VEDKWIAHAATVVYAQKFDRKSRHLIKDGKAGRWRAGLFIWMASEPWAKDVQAFGALLLPSIAPVSWTAAIVSFVAQFAQIFMTMHEN
jgi:hypothetical protein